MLVKVTGQVLSTPYEEVLASEQVDFARFRFEFSEDWDSLAITAQFTQNKNTYNVYLGTGSPLHCKLPAEIEEGIVNLSVYGVEAGGTVLATTVPLELRIERSGYTLGSEAVEPTPTLYAQLLSQMQAMVQEVAQMKDGFSPQVSVIYETHSFTFDGIHSTAYFDEDTKVTSLSIDGKDTVTLQGSLAEGESASLLVTLLSSTDQTTVRITLTGSELVEVETEGFDTLSLTQETSSAMQGSVFFTDDMELRITYKDETTGEICTYTTPSLKGEKGEDGVDGVSPTATLTQEDDGVLITLSDSEGETTAKVYNGTDGYSPQARVSQTEEGAVITITDQEGTSTATVYNGSGSEISLSGDTTAYGSISVDTSGSVSVVSLSQAVGMQYADSEGGEVFNDTSHNVASGTYAHAEGEETTASGNDSHAEGKKTTAEAEGSHAEGYMTFVLEDKASYAHVEGYSNRTYGFASHLEGASHYCYASYAHNEGCYTTIEAGADCGHAEGYQTLVSGKHSHAGGFYTIAAGERQYAIGKYNLADTESEYALVVGNGTTENDRSNALTVSWNGDVCIAGSLSMPSEWVDVDLPTEISSGSLQLKNLMGILFLRGELLTMNSFLSSGNAISWDAPDAFQDLSSNRHYFPLLFTYGGIYYSAMLFLSSQEIGILSVGAGIPAGATTTFSVTVMGE